MLGVMGANGSAMELPFGTLFGGIDEDDAMEEFDDIRRRLRACELDYMRYQTEQNVIPGKLNRLRHRIKYEDKMYDMVGILDTEWNTIRQRMREFQDRQRENSMQSIGSW